jgi:CubicO group peptidase (beta-lactamase class C family)
MVTAWSPHRDSALRAAFRDNFRSRNEVGASVSVWQGDTELLSLHDGFRDAARSVPWDADTLVPVWSAAKGPAAAAVLLALHARGGDPDTRIGDVWPALARESLAGHSVGDLLAHRLGLCALHARPSVTDHESVAAALEQQEPWWEPGTRHGYHPRTFGALAEELVRRLTGTTLSRWWRERFAHPLGLDLWFGLPEPQDPRVAELLPPRGPEAPESRPFYLALGNPDSLSAKAFSSPAGLSTVASLNRPETRRLELPGFGGIASARALARFYAILASGGRAGTNQVLPEALTRWASCPRTDGDDLVLLAPTAFAAGFMTPSRHGHPARFAGRRHAFGHPGAGGSHAFGDPGSGLGFAYVMNQMERTTLPTGKSLALLETLSPEEPG